VFFHLAEKKIWQPTFFGRSRLFCAPKKPNNCTEIEQFVGWAGIARPAKRGRPLHPPFHFGIFDAGFAIRDSSPHSIKEPAMSQMTKRAKRSEKGLLTPDNCVVTQIDLQPQMLFGVSN
jgi:hypothetical protein